MIHVSRSQLGQRFPYLEERQETADGEQGRIYVRGGKGGRKTGQGGRRGERVTDKPRGCEMRLGEEWSGKDS